jgi:hypothetical protein
MRKAIYGIILLFVGILIAVLISSLNHPIHEVKYENGRVVEKTR